MMRSFLKSKLTGLRISGVFLEYEGSITLDEEYMERGGILPFEEVQVLNLENGARFRTYTITGERGSGTVELNGPAARKGIVGDRLIVLSYVMLNTEEIGAHTPRIIRL